MTKTVEMTTAQGSFRIELDDAKAPLTVANFLAYVNSGHYDGTVFHRVIPGFMIQGGGMTPDMQEKPVRAPIKLEAKNGLSNVRGSLAMARTNVPDSATAQFFINLGDNLRLDAANSADGNGYAVFGTVFHRVIPGFMIQGGGFEPGMKQKPTLGEIKNEANNGLKNLK